MKLESFFEKAAANISEVYDCNIITTTTRQTDFNNGGHNQLLSMGFHLFGDGIEYEFKIIPSKTDHAINIFPSYTIGNKVTTVSDLDFAPEAEIVPKIKEQILKTVDTETFLSLFKL